MNEKEIEALAQMLTKASASKEEKSTVSREEQVELLKAIASKDEDGSVARKKYAESRASVLLPLLDVQSTARMIFQPELLPAGSQANYPISFDYTEIAGYLPKLGGAVTRITEGDEIYIPTFGIEGAVRYSLDVAQQGRIDIAAEQMRLLKNRIVAKEEYAAWRLIKAIHSGVNTNQTVYCSGTTENFHSFSKKALNSLYVQMDTQRRQLTDVFVSPRSLGDIREWSNTTIDYLTQREIFQNAGLPNDTVWDLKIRKVYDSSLVDNTAAWGFDVRSYGKMPILRQLETFEDPTAILQYEVGVLGRERVGFGVTDSWAVVKAVMDSSHAATPCANL